MSAPETHERRRETGDAVKTPKPKAEPTPSRPRTGRGGPRANSGGARPNAGRKPIHAQDEKPVPVQPYVEPEVFAFLMAVRRPDQSAHNVAARILNAVLRNARPEDFHPFHAELALETQVVDLQDLTRDYATYYAHEPPLEAGRQEQLALIRDALARGLWAALALLARDEGGDPPETPADDESVNPRRRVKEAGR